MEENVWPVARSGSAWRQIIIVLATLPLFMNGGPARAEDDPATLGWSETYAGVFIGAGLTDNKLVDVDGFANWGDAGSVSDYHDSGLAGGALIGKRFATGFVPLRVEIDGTFGDMSAKTNKLDPKAWTRRLKRISSGSPRRGLALNRPLALRRCLPVAVWRWPESLIQWLTLISARICRRGWTLTTLFTTARRNSVGSSGSVWKRRWPIPGRYDLRARIWISVRAPMT